MNFEHSELSALLNNLPPAARKDFLVAAIYFPGFHSTPYHESVFGFGWSEWQLVKNARPRFAGHRQPIEPLWGHYDEADPAWAAKEIDLAADHGIDAFIIDWYWYAGLKILHEQLENGFMKAPNRNRLKFGLMWANHNWANCFPAPLVGPLPPMLPIRHSLEDLDRVVDHCTERYFHESNYWHIEGKPWFSFFLLSMLLQHLGGEVVVGKAIERMRNRAVKNGLPGLYLGIFTGSSHEAVRAKSLGFDHSTTYNFTESDEHRTGVAMDHYEALMKTHAKQWPQMAGAGLPHWPVVTQGWDVSARNHPQEPWPPVRGEWPWGHVIQDNTPERFAQMVYACRRFLSSQSSQTTRVMVVNAFNEWTEGSALLPTKDQGHQVIAAFKAALTA